MEPVRRCKVCRRELGFFECHVIPVEIPATRHFTLPSGGVDVYCDKHYTEVTGA